MRAIPGPIGKVLLCAISYARSADAGPHISKRLREGRALYKRVWV